MIFRCVNLVFVWIHPALQNIQAMEATGKEELLYYSQTQLL